MKTKTIRLVVASIALVGLAGLTTPATAAQAPVALKSGWCC